MSDGADEVTFEEYRETVTERLADRGFRELDDGPPDYRAVAFHRQSVSVLQPGFVDTVAVFADFAAPAVRTVREFSGRAYEFAANHGATRSRFLGGVPAVYAVAVCDDADGNLKQWVGQYYAGHWRGYEFPVVVDLVRETVHYFSDTPLLGGRTYERFRKTAAEAFDPSTAYENVSGI